MTSNDRRDELISRVIDGEAGETDWSALRALADKDPGVWSDLAATQRQHEALCRVVDEVGAVADYVEIPEGELMTPHERFGRRMEAVRAWGGWAAAAAILLVWFTGLPAPVSPPGQPGHTAALGPAPATQPAAQQPDQALQSYLESGKQAGRVLGEIPQRVVLETRPTPDGGMEVLYLRQIVERELVDPERLYRLGRNEFGQAVPIQDEPQKRASY